MTEELAHPLRCEVFSGEAGDLPVMFNSHEGEKQLERVAVAPDRCWAQPFVCLQVPFEECVHDWSKRRHSTPSIDNGVAKCSNRSLAACSRSPVMVRYTA